MDILRSAGVPYHAADETTRWVLRFGGGLYQVVSDARVLSKDVDEQGISAAWDHPAFSKSRTFYGEDLRDVPQVESGMNFGAYLRLDRIAQQAGVKLNRSDFGFTGPEIASWSGLLLKSTPTESEPPQQQLTQRQDWLERRRADEMEQQRQIETAQKEREERQRLERLRKRNEEIDQGEE